MAKPQEQDQVTKQLIDLLKQIRITLDTGPGKEDWARDLCAKIDRLVEKADKK